MDAVWLTLRGIGLTVATPRLVAMRSGITGGLLLVGRASGQRAWLARCGALVQLLLQFNVLIMTAGVLSSSANAISTAAHSACLSIYRELPIQIHRPSDA